MKNGEVLRLVAANEMSVSEGAEKMLDHDRQERARMRPHWMPAWAWLVLVLIATTLLAACGIARD